VFYISISGKYVGAHSLDDLDSMETCEECMGSGFETICDECRDTDYEKEFWGDDEGNR